MLTLIVDDRERKVITYLPDIDEKCKDDITYRVERIYCGDFCIARGDQLMAVIERKTWADLLASMTDGRKENVNNLINAQNNHDCRAFYFIEGNASKNKKRLMSHLDHIMFRDRIHIIFTRNSRDTACRIYELMHNISTIQVNNTGAESISIHVKKTPEQIINRVWLSIPGVGPSVVELISKQCTLRELIMSESPPALDCVTYPCGRKIATDKIYAARYDNHIHEKMLECITGISNSVAKLLLENYTLKELIQNPECINTIKRNGRKLGKQIITGIKNTFI